MAQTATQETTGATRIKGPMVVTLRGAGSLGHAAQTVGAGLDIGLRVQVPTAQSADCFVVEKPDGTTLYKIGSLGGVALGGTSAFRNTVRLALTAAQIITSHSVPVSLVAAPGAGKVLILEWLTFQFKFGTVQFTGGGALGAVQHGQTANLLSGAVAQATIQAAASAFISAGAPAAALALGTNLGIDILTAGADFAAGDSTAIVTATYTTLTVG